MRVVPSKRNLRHTFGVEEAIAMSLRAATTFTIGFRAFYAFIPLVRALQRPPCLGGLQRRGGHTGFSTHPSTDGAFLGAADVVVWADSAAVFHSAGGGLSVC